MSTSNTPESIDLDELSSSGLESNLEWLRKTLQRRVKHIQDDELKRRAVRWIQQSLQVPASTVSDYIDHQLSEMEAEYRMYDHDRVENGEDAFPDACEGCPHYGGAVRLLRGARHKRSCIESPSRPRTARRSKEKSAGSPPCTTVTASRRGSRSGRRGMRDSSRRAGISTSRSRLTWA